MRATCSCVTRAEGCPPPEVREPLLPVHDSSSPRPDYLPLNARKAGRGGRMFKQCDKTRFTDVQALAFATVAFETVRNPPRRTADLRAHECRSESVGRLATPGEIEREGPGRAYIGSRVERRGQRSVRPRPAPGAPRRPARHRLGAQLEQPPSGHALPVLRCERRRGCRGCGTVAHWGCVTDVANDVRRLRDGRDCRRCRRTAAEPARRGQSQHRRVHLPALWPPRIAACR